MIKRFSSSIVLIAALALLSAGCSIFSTATFAGLVKSSNGGVDWQAINKLADKKSGNLSQEPISELAFDPFSPEHVFAGSYNSGLFKSEDAGNTWKQILSKIGVYDFAISPQDSKIIYVAGFFGGHGKVLVTKNGGGSWDEIFNEEDDQNPVRSVAVNPNNTQDVVIGLNSGNLVKSSDAGQHWRLVINFNDKINRVRWQGSGLYALTLNKGLQKSIDGGNTFQDLSSSLSSSQDFVGVSLSGPTVGSFNRMAVDVTNPSTIYLTTNAGLYKTTDEGRTWFNLNNLPLKNRSVPLRAVAIAPNSIGTVYATAGATVYKTVDGGGSWQTESVKTTGFVNALLVHPQLPQIVYAGLFSQNN